MIETETDRAALADMWGDVATVGTASLLGQYDEPQAEDLLVEGKAPTFLSSAANFQSAGVSIGTIIDSVSTHWGETRGPFKVVRWATLDDGAFIEAGLEQQ